MSSHLASKANVPRPSTSSFQLGSNLLKKLLLFLPINQIHRASNSVDDFARCPVEYFRVSLYSNVCISYRQLQRGHWFDAAWIAAACICRWFRFCSCLFMEVGVPSKCESFDQKAIQLETSRQVRGGLVSLDKWWGMTRCTCLVIMSSPFCVLKL